jgi:BirA family biotin operon repressor/biotin-[acetyl-CoA-carboxylase] ligase
MNEQMIYKALSGLPLGGLRYFDRVGSSNDQALIWAAQGADDLSLVVADEQSAGRGRAGRKWYTPAGAALALSLILRPSPAEQVHPSLFTGLGALALVRALKAYRLEAQIKWPNDVVLAGQKVAGILVETAWIGQAIESVVLGMGVNVSTAAVPPPEQLDFPATSLEESIGRSLERTALLHDILAALIDWRSRLGSEGFIRAWESALAYRGEWVQVWVEGASQGVGELIGLQADGSLSIRTSSGELLVVHFGDVHLRLASL